MNLNFLIIALAALVPIIIGALYYNPKILGKSWIKATGLTEEELRKANMALVFGLTIVLSFMIAMILSGIVIHQYGLMSVIMNEPGVMKQDPNAEAVKWYNDAMAKYGTNFRTFKHGAFHGVLLAIMLVLPVIGINALFERKSFRYVMIHLGFWALCLGIMGGMICQWA
jgi:hypothetical protein